MVKSLGSLSLCYLDVSLSANVPLLCAVASQLLNGATELLAEVNFRVNIAKWLEV